MQADDLNLVHACHVTAAHGDMQEFMTRMFIVNIPMVFGAIWRVAQMFVDERVKAKIRFLKRSELHMLHEFIDRSILPVSLGGDCKEQVISTRGGEFPLPPRHTIMYLGQRTFVIPTVQHCGRSIPESLATPTCQHNHDAPQ